MIDGIEEHDWVQISDDVQWCAKCGALRLRTDGEIWKQVKVRLRPLLAGSFVNWEAPVTVVPGPSLISKLAGICDAEDR